MKHRNIVHLMFQCNIVPSRISKEFMTSGSHILSQFDTVLTELRNATIRMGSVAQQNLDLAIRGMLERDDDLSNRAIVADHEEDVLEQEIDRMGMDIILRYQPVARDLRIVIASMKTAKHLERVSAQAESIARAARKMSQNEEIKQRHSIEPLHKIVSSMLSDAVIAYSNSDGESSREILEKSKELKKSHKSTAKIFSNALEDGSDRYRDYLDLVFICRWLETVGSLAMNIAEDVIFEETSQDIRHSV